MKTQLLLFALLGIGFSSLSFHTPAPDAPHPDWGFFAHKRINRLAVLTLPPEMMVFFKTHIDFISDHAVDPDMRRYATKHEAPRHYIDLDNYGAPPFDNLPRLRLDAMLAYTDIFGINESGDTLLVFGKDKPVADNWKKRYKYYFAKHVLPRLYADEPFLNVDSLNSMAKKTGEQAVFQKAFYTDHLSEHGIVPWHLQKMQDDLTEAFKRRDTRRILNLCAEMGHYIGDAHVPLHTTSNYNGQKTGQHGIHGFWESRIPELFADDEYDYFVGKPRYVRNPPEWFWEMVLTSYGMVDSVLTLEKNMRKTFPSDRQMCPDMRLGVMLVTPCRDFASAYQDAMNGMVERRFRAAIHSVASAWYTAWADAGQPVLSDLKLKEPTEAEKKEEAELTKLFNAGKIQGRPEDH